MPLVKRLVDPVYVGRSALDKQVRNELEGVTVNSLAGVIKQLSSISKHAEDLFGDLISEAGSIYQRSSLLSQRVQTLYEKTSQLDSAVKEDLKVEDFNVMNHFKSRRQEEQQVLNPNTLPQALKEVYSSCDEPPTLYKFTPYRDDGKEGLKFYTDRNYFYDLWVQQQTKELKERKKRGDKKRRRRKDNKPTKKVHGVKKKDFSSVDAEFRSGDVIREPPAKAYHSQAPKDIAPPPTPPQTTAQEHRPSGGPPPPPPAPLPSQAQLSAPTAPPPPPPPVAFNTGIPPPPPPPMTGSPAMPHVGMEQSPYFAPPPPVMGGPPAPPPPPAPMGMPAPPPPPPPPGPAAQVAVAAPVVRAKTPEPDPRQDLLSAIMMGKKLRKVEHKDEVKKQEYGTDVASILKRRIVMEVSDSSDDSGSDSDGSWSD